MITGTSTLDVQSCKRVECCGVSLLSWRLAVPRLKVTHIIQPFCMPHIGAHIKDVMVHKERTPTWLAHKIHCSRSNVYYILEQPNINTELLMMISVALEYNFFALYAEEVVQKIGFEK